MSNTSYYSLRRGLRSKKENKIDDDYYLLLINKRFVVTYEVKRITIKKVLSNSPLSFLLKEIHLAERPKTCTMPLGSLGSYYSLPSSCHGDLDY